MEFLAWWDAQFPTLSRDQNTLKTESLEIYGRIFNISVKDVKVGGPKTMVKLHSSYVAGSTGASERMVIRQSFCTKYKISQKPAESTSSSSQDPAAAVSADGKPARKRGRPCKKPSAKNRKT